MNRNHKKKTNFPSKKITKSTTATGRNPSENKTKRIYKKRLRKRRKRRKKKTNMKGMKKKVRKSRGKMIIIMI